MVKSILKRLLPESLREWTRQFRAWAIASLAQHTNLTRGPLSHLFIRGQGIEIGAYNWPLAVPRGVQVTQVDREPVAHYSNRVPEGSKLVHVDINAMIETLEPIASETQDFVIANHVVEHSENPILAIETMLRVLKPGGILFLTLPDKRFTFDLKRERHSFDHLLRDFQEGPMWSRKQHYIDAAIHYQELSDPQAIDSWVEENMSIGADIHFHVWTQADMFEMLSRLQVQLGFPFDIEAMSKTGLESIFILKKHASSELSHVLTS